jgi:hypothetical protein
MKTMICIFLFTLFAGNGQQDEKTEELFNTRFKGVVHSMEPATSVEGLPIKVIEVYKDKKMYLTLMWSLNAIEGLFDHLECGDSIFIEHETKDVMIKKNKENHEGDRVIFFDNN